MAIENDNWYFKMGRLCKDYPQLLEISQQYHEKLQYGHTVRIESIDFGRTLGQQTMWIFTKNGKKFFVDSAFGDDQGLGQQIGQLLKNFLKKEPTIKPTDIKAIFLFTERGNSAYFSTLASFYQDDFVTYLISIE